MTETAVHPTSGTKSERTKARIIQAALRLFGERGIEAVSIRDIAAEAGITHALVHRYFGTREELLASVLSHEIETTGRVLADRVGDERDPLVVLRVLVEYGLSDGRGFFDLVMQADTAGYAPETLTTPDADRPFDRLAHAIGALRDADRDGREPSDVRDVRILLLIVTATMSAVATHPRWLLASVGLDPSDTEATQADLVDMLVRIVASAAGLSRIPA